MLFGRTKGLKKGALIGIPSFKFSYARGSKRLPECAAMGNTNQKHIRLVFFFDYITCRLD